MTDPKVEEPCAGWQGLIWAAFPCNLFISFSDRSDKSISRAPHAIPFPFSIAAESGKREVAWSIPMDLICMDLMRSLMCKGQNHAKSGDRESMLPIMFHGEYLPVATGVTGLRSWN
jgi:hypothetical protein